MKDLGIRTSDLRAILFDLDGTLLDSFPIHLEAYQATFAKFGVTLTAAEFRRCYSPNWNEFYRAVGLPPDVWDSATSYWLEEAAAREPLLLPGVTSTLRRLGTRFRLGLVTSGSKERVRRDLTRAGIGAFFEVVVTGDDVQRPKPSPEGVHAALRALGLPAGQALYVGDTPADYELARAAQVAFVGVTSEFSHALPSDESRHVAAVPDLIELLQVE